MNVVRLRPHQGKGTGLPGPRRSSIQLTDTEQMRLRAALRNLRALYGSWDCLAEVMGVRPGTLATIVSGKPTSPGMAVRAARAAGTTVEAILGDLKVAASCPHCGAAWEVRS
ncbi:hypothetical protein [Chondromyces crocatus]|uniref:Uncharacterized protein n=1 Tax=Chondromyces crocatus TaxID=52 RepID=A0A0K1EFC5_CHOCO|nr:hypothetical protein [Chondromyces crocatus]AKT39555.1 uncharacterized protein CMC5_037020 [Chondromyces crocatus]